MRHIKIISIGLLALLILSISAVIAPVAAANPPNNIQVTQVGNNTMIKTSDYTVIFARNGSMPSFVWWANNDTSDVYVVQYKGLIEFAQIDNSSGFQLKNEAESTLLAGLINNMNVMDEAKLDQLAQGGIIISKISSTLTLAGVAINSGYGNGTKAVADLRKEASDLQTFAQNVSDSTITASVNQSVYDINAVINAINSGNNPQDLINTAMQQLGNLSNTGLNAAKQVINDRIAAREQLVNLSSGWHPAALPFGASTWTVTNPTTITDSNGNAIGITFTFTLVNAPSQFAFANNNVQLVIRIYNAPVDEQVSQGGQSYSYSLASGEMKMDFIVSNWQWNFAPSVVQLFNSKYAETGIHVTPALALQVDAAAYNISSSMADRLLGNLSMVSAPVAAPTAIFSQGPTTTSIPVTGQSADATQLNYTPATMNQNIAGKNLKIASQAKLTLKGQGTLEGFFKFVPYATVDNNGVYSTVDVGASYYMAGNHLSLYITYPYFNGTLTHDPSIGVQSPSGSNSAPNPSYIVTQQATGAINIQQIPSILVYPSVEVAATAAMVVLVGAVVVIVLARRHPAVVNDL